MTSKAKRRTLMLGLAALVALTAGTALAPELLAAPKPKTDFTISVDLEGLYEWEGTYWYYTGTWSARGTLTVSGAPAVWDCGRLTLSSPDPDQPGAGSMLIDFGPDTYVITEATGVYAHLQGVTGRYTSHWTDHYNKKTGESSSTGAYTLTGSMPQ
jgi:hypothetical protein